MLVGPYALAGGLFTSDTMPCDYPFCARTFQIAAAGLRNRVVTEAAPWMTATEPLQPEPAAPEHSVPFNGLEKVV